MTHAATQHNVPIMATHTQQTPPFHHLNQLPKGPASFQAMPSYPGGEQMYEADGGRWDQGGGRGRGGYNGTERRNSNEYSWR